MLAAGGTGGHFYPGLVAALALRRRGWEPLLLLREGDPSSARAEAEGLPVLPVRLRGLPRRLGPELLAFAARLPGALRSVSLAVRAFAPDLAVGMGGYLTFPLAWAARRRGVPLAVHEANAVLGLANAAARSLGARVLWGLPPAAGGAAEVVGVPVRPELRRRGDPAQARRLLGLASAAPTALVMGGSQGAAVLNEAVPRALAAAGIPQALHLAGRGRAEAARDAYRRAGITAEVREYMEDMSSAYAAADLAVCRAGAGTLAELAAQRLPAVLVPYPHATAGHQDANARVFERAGAAARLPEAGLPEGLAPALRGLLAPGRLTAMSEAYAGLGLPDPGAAEDALLAALEEAAG